MPIATISVVDPKLFILDLDPDPTSEKFLIRIWIQIQIQILDCFLLNPVWSIEIRKFTVPPVFLKINNYVASFLKKELVKFHL